ncbi:hypothetical protein BJY00DRAFT_324647 [Aspergillus carlsbadensis]|nr:hypothetical protein BJY00DRAFT_324647 [Aspergillus carlsbadensis]
MQRALFTKEELRLATERRLKYLGTAKVPINQIQFDPPLPRDLDSKNLNRLQEIFRKNHCRRLDVNNHVPAIVSQHDFILALQNANVPRRSMLTNNPQHFPVLGFMAGQLRALHGRHRVQAGAKVLPPTDRWWTVDLYLDDLGEGLKTSLVEEYANQKKPTDGEIYRKIRQYEIENNETFRQRWFVRLSSSNQDRLDQLDNRRNRRLRRAFDQLLAIPGLWLHGMRISMLHRLIATGCVEEIITYLDHIGDFWSSMVAPGPSALKKIDADTIDSLQLLAPGKCRTDAQKARGLVLGGEVFAGFDDERRRLIWNRMQEFDGLIPSLYTFFEDFKYLESCSRCIKRLIGPSTSSVWGSMSYIFTPSEGDEGVIQTSESTVRMERASDAERLEKAYLQVWLYAMRHYPLMPPDPKNDDDLLAKPARGKADDRVIYEMAELARRLGFDSPEIRALTGGSPDHQIARAALLQARKPGRFQYDPQQFDNLVQRVVECFAAAVPEEPGETCELLADSSDSPLLFLDRLHADVEVADTITTFFVRRCVYFAFFGKPTQSGSGGDHTRHPPTDNPPASSLFVKQSRPSGNDGLGASPAPRPHDRGELLPSSLGTGVNGERMGQQQRRIRKIRARRHRLQHSSAGQEPMELVQIGDEEPDESMSDPEPLTWAGSPAANPQVEAVPPSSALVNLTSLEHGIEASVSENEEHTSPAIEQPDSSMPSQLVLDDADTSSQHTRISLEAIPRTRDSNQSTPTADPGQGSSAMTQPTLDAYLNHLERARKEQEELENRLKQERLKEELNLSREEAFALEPVPRPEQTPIMGTEVEPTDVTQGRGPASHPWPGDSSVRSHSPPGDITAPAGEALAYVGITIWSYERDDWRLSDRLQVDPSDPSPLERLATKYTRKDYSLYDKNMQSLSPAKCYGAATIDGNNAIFIISKHEEEKLAAEGRFVSNNKFQSLVSRVLGEPEPASPVKRLQFHSVSSEEP